MWGTRESSPVEVCVYIGRERTVIARVLRTEALSFFLLGTRAVQTCCLCVFLPTREAEHQKARVEPRGPDRED